MSSKSPVARSSILSSIMCRIDISVSKMSSSVRFSIACPSGIHGFSNTCLMSSRSELVTLGQWVNPGTVMNVFGLLLG